MTCPRLNPGGHPNEGLSAPADAGSEAAATIEHAAAAAAARLNPAIWHLLRGLWTSRFNRGSNLSRDANEVNLWSAVSRVSRALISPPAPTA